MGLLKKIGKIAGKALTGDFLGAAGSAIGAIAGSKGSKRAGKASAAGYAAAGDELRNGLTAATGYQRPFLDMASPAINSLTALNSGDYSGFESSPDYQFALQQGGQAVDRSAAARGNLNSGNTLVAQQRFGQGLAGQQLGAYRNSLFQTIGTGQHAADNLTSATLNTSQGIGNTLIGGGDARASGIVGSTNAITGGIEDLAGVAGNMVGNKLVKKPKVKATQAVNYRQPTARAV